MIALCLQHHKEADAGAFTPDQLRKLKQEPYVLRAGVAPGGKFNWRREQLVVRAGGLTAIGCGTLLRFGDTNAIWLSTASDGSELMNLDVWAPDGTIVFSMRDNDWIALGPLEDVECPPSGRSLILRAPSIGVRLAVEFNALSDAQLHQYFFESRVESATEMNKHREEAARQAEQRGAPRAFVEATRGDPVEVKAYATDRADELMEAVRRHASASEFALCEIDARLVFPVAMRLTPTQLVLPGNNVIRGGTVIGDGVAVQIG